MTDDLKYYWKFFFSPEKLIVPKLRGTNKKYQKFIILAHPRSGSNYLRSCLNSHPNVICFGEIFNITGIFFAVGNFRILTNWLKNVRNKYPIAFLNQFIFRPYNERIALVGFKAFSEQLKEGNHLQVWDWIYKQKDIKIIVLHRENLLTYHTSFEKAKISQEWISKTGVVSTSQSIVLDISKCEREFKWREKELSDVREKSKNLDVMEITYEELTQNKADSLLKIQNYLGLEPVELDSNLTKQETRPLSETIENYEELKQHFISTKWSKFFITE